MEATLPSKYWLILNICAPAVGVGPGRIGGAFSYGLPGQGKGKKANSETVGLFVANPGPEGVASGLAAFSERRSAPYLWA